jgi:hypothetical protein
VDEKKGVGDGEGRPAGQMQAAFEAMLVPSLCACVNVHVYVCMWRSDAGSC